MYDAFIAQVEQFQEKKEYPETDFLRTILKFYIKSLGN